MLVVLDNTGGMVDYWDRLAGGVPALLAALASWDTQLIVVTTDLDSKDSAGASRETRGTRTIPYGAEWPFAADLGSLISDCSFVAVDHGCARGEDPATRIVRSSVSGADQRAQITANLEVGNCGAGNERGLEAMTLALEQSAAGGCNEGFLRSDAELMAIIATDDDDADQLSSIPQAPIDVLLDRLAAMKPLERVHLGLLIGAVAGEPARCGKRAPCGSLCADPAPSPGSEASCTTSASCPAGEQCFGQRCQNKAASFWDYCWDCSFYNAPDCCYARPGVRYVSFARALEERAGGPAHACAPATDQRACAIESICDADLGSALTRIAGLLPKTCPL